MRASLALAPGLLILQATHHAHALVDRVFLSYLPTGAIGALAYAMTLVALVPGVLSLGGAFITLLAEQGTRAARAERLNQAISLAIFLSTGAMLVLALFGDAVVAVLLQRGLFGADDTRLVHAALTAAAAMMLPLFLLTPLDQVFQVEGRVAVMVRRALLGLVINAALNAVFLFGLGWGVTGIALATTLTYWLVLLFALRAAAGLGLRIHWRRHLAWFAWLGTALAPLWLLRTADGYALLAPWAQTLVATAAALALTVLAGLTYPGSERRLVSATLARLGLARS